MFGSSFTAGGDSYGFGGPAPMASDGSGQVGMVVMKEAAEPQQVRLGFMLWACP